MYKAVLFFVLVCVSTISNADRFTMSHEFDHPDIKRVIGYYEYDPIGVPVDGDNICEYQFGNSHITRIELSLVKNDGTTETLETGQNVFVNQNANIKDNGLITQYVSAISTLTDDGSLFIMFHELNRVSGLDCAPLSGEDTFTGVSANIATIGGGSVGTTYNSKDPVIVITE